MGVKIGGANMRKLYIGSTLVGAVYVGNTKVFPEDGTKYIVDVLSGSTLEDGEYVLVNTVNNIIALGNVGEGTYPMVHGLGVIEPYDDDSYIIPDNYLTVKVTVRSDGKVLLQDTKTNNYLAVTKNDGLGSMVTEISSGYSGTYYNRVFEYSDKGMLCANNSTSGTSYLYAGYSEKTDSMYFQHTWSEGDNYLKLAKLSSAHTISSLIKKDKITASVSNNILTLKFKSNCPDLHNIADFVDVFCNGVKVDGYTYNKVYFDTDGYISSHKLSYIDILNNNHITISFDQFLLGNLTLNSTDAATATDLTLTWPTGGNWGYNDSKPFSKTNVKNLTVKYGGNISSFHNLFLGYAGNSVKCDKNGSAYNLTSTDISGCFEFCSNLTSLPEINWANVANIGYTFENCYKLTRIGGDGYTTKALNSAAQAFNQCGNLTYIGVILNVTNLSNNGSNYSMFAGCNKLSHLRLLGVNNCDWDFSNMPLDDDSVRYIVMNSVAQTTAHTMKFNRDISSLFSSEEWSTVSDKGWTYTY